MSSNAEKRRRKRNRRNDRPVQNQRTPIPILDEIFRTILPQYDEEFQLMLKDAHRPLDRNRLESVARERITKLRAVFTRRLQEIHEKWMDLATAVRSAAISVGELVNEHEDFTEASREELNLCEELLSLDNMFSPLTVDRMVAIRADEVKLMEATMRLMGNANSCPNEIESEKFSAQIYEIERLREQRVNLKKMVECLNQRKLDVAIRMIEIIEAMKNADDRLECGEDDMLVCGGAIEDLRSARQEAERSKRDLDSAVADLREINPSADIALENL